jgi:hypothetical protein
MLVRKVISLLCFMTSLLLFATCPKSTPNGSLISKLATDRGIFKLLAKSAGSYILGHDDRYITVVDADDSLSALCLSNQTTLRAIRILDNHNSPLRFTVEFQVKDPAFLNTANITLTDEQLKVLGSDYTSQLHNEFVAVQYNSTFLRKRKNDSTANSFEPAQKRQNAQGIPLLPVAPFLLPVAPLLPVSPPVIPLLQIPVVPLLPVSLLVPVAPFLSVAESLIRDFTIGEFTRLLFPRPKETTPTVTPNQGICVLPPKAYDLHALSFHPAIDSYRMNFSMPGQDRKIEALISTTEILQFPNGKEAIHKYNDLHKPQRPSVVAPSMDHPVAVYFSFINHILSTFL